MILKKSDEWDYIIQPKNKWYELNLKEVWTYRDLLLLFVRRDFISAYKQTVLGPLWFVIQPCLTTIAFTLVFGNIAQLSTEGIPKLLFYLSGITIWNYFADCFYKTSAIFAANQNLFGKVYFPRLVMPISAMISNLIKFGIQVILFLCVWIYFNITTNVVHSNISILLLPVLIIIMAILGSGFGMIVSALTAKYRDLSFLVGFGIQLMMYASPLIYPISQVPEKFQWLLKINPMTSIITTFKYGFLGIGELDLSGLIYSSLFGLLTFVLGVIIFNKVEKTFIDTV